MAQQLIIFGDNNPNNGDTIFDAFTKVNLNANQLTNVDNTSDINKPISTATQNALNLKAPLASPSITGTLTVVNDAVINGVTIGKGGGGILTNTVVGRSALISNTSGLRIVAIGNQTSPVNTTGSWNVAIGDSSLFNNTIGSYITAIGQGALSDNILYSNVTGIGYNSQANASNQVNLGDTAITSLRCNVTSITSLSDERDKKDIVEISEGLDFISKLKPVTFTWNQRDGNRVGIKSAGFIAQDLLALQNDSLIGENLDLVSEIDSEKLEARYANLMPVMIKAIQELNELLKAK